MNTYLKNTPMSKQSKIEAIKEVMTGVHKTITFMKIFEQATPADEKAYYSKVPWSKNVDVICCNEAGAKLLEDFLSSDIERLPFEDRQQLNGLFDNGGA